VVFNDQKVVFCFFYDDQKVVFMTIKKWFLTIKKWFLTIKKWFLTIFFTEISMGTACLKQKKHLKLVLKKRHITM